MMVQVYYAEPVGLDEGIEPMPHQIVVVVPGDRRISRIEIAENDDAIIQSPSRIHQHIEIAKDGVDDLNTAWMNRRNIA